MVVQNLKKKKKSIKGSHFTVQQQRGVIWECPFGHTKNNSAASAV